MNSAVVRSIEPADVGDVIGSCAADRARRARCIERDVGGGQPREGSGAAEDRGAAARAVGIKSSSANTLDLDRARKAGVQAALLDRLTLDDDAIEQMAVGVEQVARLSDPIGEIIELKPRPSGIKVGRMRVPLGVIAIVYESRPNVTVDAAALCIKSGNSAILRGGSEAIESNRVLAQIVREGLG